MLLYSLLAVQRASAVPCASSTVQKLNVRNSAEAQALARAVACEGGSFDIIWSADVLLNQTISISSSTTVNIRAAPEQEAVISGGGTVRLFDFVGNGTLYLEGLVLRDGFVQGSGGAVNAAVPGSFLSLKDCTFLNNTARENTRSHSCSVLVQAVEHRRGFK